MTPIEQAIYDSSYAMTERERNIATEFYERGQKTNMQEPQLSNPKPEGGENVPTMREPDEQDSAAYIRKFKSQSRQHPPIKESDPRDGQEPQPAGQSVEGITQDQLENILGKNCYTVLKHEGSRRLLEDLNAAFATSQQQARDQWQRMYHDVADKLSSPESAVASLRQQVAMDTECIERIRAAAVRDKFRADEAEAKVVELERGRDMWKSNHDNQVRIKRMLADRPDLKDRAESVSKLLAAVKTLRGALEKCEERFKQYAESHFKKKTVEADIKGMSNFEMVHVCVDALESTKEFA